MAEFILEPKPLEMAEPNTDKVFKNVKEFKASDGSFAIKEGRVEMRDTDGNIVILFDPNG
jgi:hypothetical protein